MNRLVIIGNGFDLAHGLPTSYKDFMDDFWRNSCNTKGLKVLKYDDELITIDFEFGGRYNIANYNAIDKINDYQSLILFYESNRQDIYGKFTFEFKNKFFRIICDNSIENWVDIENEYYNELKKIVKSTSLNIESKKQKAIVLNKEFEQVKNRLEKYLKENVLEKFNLGEYPDRNGDLFKFLNILKPISVTSNELNLLKELPKDDHSEIEILFDEERKERKQKKSLFVLNFNYTPTVLRYLNSGSANENPTKIHIPIHGTLGNELYNKINFGFGDEMDDDYKVIENLDDNEYLKNFKSFQYLQNSNYKKLLDFIDSEKFQVLIMGHSCGLSDRTLLNTVFEHNYCRSIKVFYYQKDDGTDNYTEIIQNISRHFNKKKLMREKIVNKTLCQPLPKIQLPKKK